MGARIVDYRITLRSAGKVIERVTFEDASRAEVDSCVREALSWAERDRMADPVVLVEHRERVGIDGRGPWSQPDTYELAGGKPARRTVIVWVTRDPEGGYPAADFAAEHETAAAARRWIATHLGKHPGARVRYDQETRDAENGKLIEARYVGTFAHTRRGVERVEVGDRPVPGAL